jgi:hypothetical protein
VLLLVVLEVELVGPLDVLTYAVEAEEKLTLADLTPRRTKISEYEIYRYL